MDTKIFFGVLSLSLLAIALGLLIPVKNIQNTSTLPWQVDINTQGYTRVFGLSLNQSTVNDAESQFASPAEISLFAEADGQQLIEAYFDKISLNGLRAKMILVIDFSPEQVQAIFQRGARISALGNGRKKVMLSKQDLIRVRAQPIKSITYLPRAKLQIALLKTRFGEPAQRIKEANSDMSHWLYPHIGLDIAINSKGKAVFQYVSPNSFSELTLKLKQN